jgi:hypothetical protein
MTDKEKVMKELEKNINNLEEQKLLHGICDEIFEEYDKGSVKAVSALLQGKINLLKSKFDDTHNGLLKKMGL